MRRYTALFFLSVYLLAFTEARQLLKMPNLIEHYIQHTHQDRGTTVLSFLKMHYLDPPVKDADWQDDMKLPFKTPSHSMTASPFQAPPKSFEFSFTHKAVHFGIQHNFAYSEQQYPQIFISVWQPPKVTFS